MATFWLINNVPLASGLTLAGTKIDDVSDPVSAIQAAGGVLFPTGTPAIDAAAAGAQSLRLRGGDPSTIQGLMIAAVAKLDV